MPGERELTDSLRAFFGAARDVLVPLGDDAAVVRAFPGATALCCDPVVQGVHFDGATPLPLVGRKAVNRNLSDLAAMGATPKWLLCSVVAPRGFGRDRLMQVLRGVRAAARAAGATVVGGDVAAAAGPLTVTVSAVGEAPAAPLRRDALRVGDTLHVTGPLGGSIAGHHLRFRPAVAEGRWLAGQPGVHAAIDVSDGLLLDLQAMLAASGGLGAKLDASAIPVRAAARRLARGHADRALQRAMRDGEDHCLLFAVRSGARLSRGGPLTARARRAIGCVVRDVGITLARNGVERAVDVGGYQHSISR